MVTRPVLERHVEAYLLTQVRKLAGTTIHLSTISKIEDLMVIRLVLERHVEAYLLTQVRKLAGTTIKMATLHQRSLPDRLVVLPGGKVGFAELKRPGGKATAAQLHIIDKLQRLGCVAEVVVGKEGVDEFLASLKG